MTQSGARTLHRDTDVTLQTCTCCDGEGRLYRSGWDRNGPIDIDEGECPHCEGTGGALEPCELIEEEDLDSV